ncbi:MAG TPA: histidine kinase [Flavisolibacter sp.]|jgi:signal transduction histidine kinase|nr:histidine kinase [Flavisolibacter sp.]
MQPDLRIPLYFLFTVLFCLVTAAGTAQEREIESIPNQPSPEAYDLLKDSKGYIWVAHEFGISRYDGANFITLQNPRQNSISLTDMIEDKTGRIWCHNFSGQIFYIENLQLHLLEAYKHQDEQDFPRIAICGDELIATSKKGLFVYNLLTGKSTYHFIKYGASTLTQVGNKVVCFNNYDFYCYEAGKPLTKLTFGEYLPDHFAASLQNVCLKDTFYLIVNPRGKYYKLSLKQDRILNHGVIKTGAFINTISKQNEKIWVHTKEHSVTIDGKEQIKGMNLSDVLTDNLGNLWMSSLKKGLSVRYNTQPIKKISDSLSIDGQNIRRIHTEDSTLFLGTSSGMLYKLDLPGSLQYLSSIPKEAGAIERITPFDKNHLFVAASVGSYTYHYQTNTLKPLPVSITAKDIVIRDEKVYVATPFGIKFFPLAHLNDKNPPLAQRPLFEKTTRCRSLAFLNDSLIAVYNDGVFILHNNKIKPLFYQQNPIYATTVRMVGSKLLIGTYNQGLLIYEKGSFQKITDKEGLASNFIKDIKIISGSTWLVYTNRFQLLNPSLTGIENYTFPFPGGGINDFNTIGNQLYLSTSDGLYATQMTRPSSAISTKTYIDNITVNGNSLVATNTLNYFQNHLQFQVSTPYFSPNSKIVYQYRLTNTPNNEWQQGAPGQTAFNVVALEPGTYDFEIVATDENRKIISQPAIYHFEIMAPWYQHWAFNAFVILWLVGLIGGAVWFYFANRLRRQRQVYKKQLAIQAERQRISEEIHDDIGAGLLAMRLQTEITKNKLPEGEARQEMGKIHTAISELSHKMREVIWSLNTDNDRLENLLFYIRRQAVGLFENSPTSLKVVFPSHEIPDVNIHGEKRRHIYLAVKEALHNCLKHSQAHNCTLTMRIDGSALYISVADDGRGFAAPQGEHTGNGLSSMKKRMQQIEGVLEMETQERTVVQFMVPLTESV